MSTVPDPLIPPNPDADTPPAAKKASKRPTTRAGRAAAAAAKKAGNPKPDTPPRSAPTVAPRKAALENRIADQLITIGVTVAAAGALVGPKVQVDGVIICRDAPSIAKALSDVAAGNPAVARALERMLSVGTYAALSSALLPMVLAILANHEVVPPALVAQLGIEVPELPAAPAHDPFDPANNPPMGGPGVGLA